MNTKDVTYECIYFMSFFCLGFSKEAIGVSSIDFTKDKKFNMSNVKTQDERFHHSSTSLKVNTNSSKL